MWAVLPIQLSIFLNKRISRYRLNLLVFDVEVDIKSVEKLGLKVAKQVLGHRNIQLAATVDLLRWSVCANLFI